MDNLENAGFSRGQKNSELRYRKVTVVTGDIDHTNEGLYRELERLRSLVDVIEEEHRGSESRPRGIAACFPVALDNSVMSTIFGIVFFTVLTVSIYAFNNLYRAIYKRFFEQR